MKRTRPQEPDFQMACQWWPDLTNIWTPIGWKNNLFRFNVFWNGMILAKPDLNAKTRYQPYKDQGVQIGFIPHPDDTPWRRSYQYVDDGFVNQSWDDQPAPVLMTDWPEQGALMRQYCFVHIPGARDVVTGTEPLFAWIRLEVHDICEGLPMEDTHGFQIRLNAPHITPAMSTKDNVHFHPEQELYPRRLRPVPASYSRKRGWRLVEPDGRVRLAIMPRQECNVKFMRPGEDKRGGLFILTDERTYKFYIRMPARVGKHVDLLVPMLPAEPAVFNRELALGYDRALKEANRYWKPAPRSAARVRVPEQAINHIVETSPKFAEIIAEKHPKTGQYCLITGTFAYAALWATPGAMTLVMLLDTLGRHDSAARYLEIFREEQGKRSPPGKFYKPHPGYLGVPEAFKSVDWLTDHGAILYAICMHALLTDDQAFIQRFSAAIIKACEWIRDCRAIAGHGGVAGILPPAVASDEETTIQAIWTDGWNFKGLTTAVRLLQRIGHPRANEFRREARAYQETFVAAFRAKCRTMPVWRDAHGRRHHFAPMSLHGDQKFESRGFGYLDCGPLFLVFAGLLSARDPIMRSTCRWFREGPPTEFMRYDSNCNQVPCLLHEISSAEPCYSWNLFHAHELGDRPKYLEGMYSLLAGSISRKTQAYCETRGGMSGLTPCTPAVYLVRLAMLDDQIEKRALHVLRLMPLAWLKPGEESAFENMPTEFGPVTLKTRVSRDGKTLAVSFKPKFRNGQAPKRIVLHVPPAPKLRRVVVNGKAYKGRVITLT